MRSARHLPHIRRHTRRDERQDVVGDFRLQRARVTLQDGNARRHVRRVQVRDDSRRKTRHELVRRFGQLIGCAVRAHDNQTAFRRQHAEHRAKFVLRLLVRGDTLRVVKQQDVPVGERLAKFIEVLVARRAFARADEPQAGHIRHAKVGVSRGYRVANRLQQVRLPDADLAVDVERRELARKPLRDRARDGQCKGVCVAGEKCLERERPLQPVRQQRLAHAVVGLDAEAGFFHWIEVRRCGIALAHVHSAQARKRRDV